MAAYTVKLADFQGPLDLLVHLIEKDKIDIYDIPIVSITEQYIAYLNTLQEYDLDVASEFLLMAAMLLQIKSRMLLPKEKDGGVEEEDPRTMLVEMLVEYRRFKKRAVLLRQCLDKASLCWSREPAPAPRQQQKVKRYYLGDLLRALANLFPEREQEQPIIPRQEFHVQDKMDDIMGMLENRQKGLSFQQVLKNKASHSEVIASFLAILELLRLQKICIRQDQPFAPITLSKREEGAYGTA